jgi:hypothetical protein
MRAPRFRIRWLMVAVAIVAVAFGAVRAVGDLGAGDGRRLLLFGAFPMANILVIGPLLARKDPRSRPFLLGFEIFAALALSAFVLLMTFFPSRNGPVFWYLSLAFHALERIIGQEPTRVHQLIDFLVEGFLLSIPQFVFALIGGFLSQWLISTVARR